MGRVIQTGQTPAKVRHQHMRSCAEVVRLLAQRNGFDGEAQDMAAFLVFSLRGAYATIDESAQVWEERGYYKKAEKARARWGWARRGARDLEKALLKDKWDEIPALVIALVPHLQNVTVNQVTRDADWWCGALRALKKQAEKRKQPGLV